MQFLAVLAVLASAVMAQDTSALPACAATCIEASLPATACAADDTACLCGDDVFFATVQTCVLAGCSVDDVATTLAVSTQQCIDVGVPLRKRSSVFGRKH